LFVDPQPRQIEAAAMLGADFVEIHTGSYANLADADLAHGREVHNEKMHSSRRALPGSQPVKQLNIQGMIAPEFSDATRSELEKIRAAVKLARSLKLKPNAGHGLNYGNVLAIAGIRGIMWLHIGHAVVARSLITGMERAVREMLRLINYQR
jgi:pyridoxine 5-phosphate synthase